MLKSLFLIFSTLVCLYAEELPEPYASVNLLPFDDHGWFGNQPQLDAVFRDDIKVVIEIGSWLGKSTRYFAAKVGLQGKVYAIDTWLGSDQEKEHQVDPRLKHLYQLFLSNTIQAGFANIIVPFKMKSQEAASALNVKGDLIYIDGAHDYKSVYEDILAWKNHLNDGGILCGDDWEWKSVRDAVRAASKKLGRGFHHERNFWWFD